MELKFLFYSKDNDNAVRTTKRDPRNSNSKLRSYFSLFVDQSSPNQVDCSLQRRFPFDDRPRPILFCFRDRRAYSRSSCEVVQNLAQLHIWCCWAAMFFFGGGAHFWPNLINSGYNGTCFNIWWRSTPDIRRWNKKKKEINDSTKTWACVAA